MTTTVYTVTPVPPLAAHGSIAGFVNADAMNLTQQELNTMRNLPVLLIVMFLGVAICISSSDATAGDTEAPKKSSETDDAETLDVRLARAHLKLAELDLQRISEANKVVPNVFPGKMVETLQLHVAHDKARLEESLAGRDADPHQTYIRTAEVAAKFAEAELNRIQKISGVSDLEITRAKVAFEVAQLNLERTKQLSSPGSLLMHMQWQIDQLQHQVFELSMERYSR
jgi:multidrug resistance efflux pump